MLTIVFFTFSSLFLFAATAPTTPPVTPSGGNPPAHSGSCLKLKLTPCKEFLFMDEYEALTRRDDPLEQRYFNSYNRSVTRRNPLPDHHGSSRLHRRVNTPPSQSPVEPTSPGSHLGLEEQNPAIGCLWYTDVGFGEAGTAKFPMAVDTGSPRIWLASTECKEANCNSHKQDHRSPAIYEPPKAKTEEPEPKGKGEGTDPKGKAEEPDPKGKGKADETAKAKEITVKYASGETATGVLYEDHVHIGSNILVTEVMAAHTIHKNFALKKFLPDGILGVSRASGVFQPKSGKAIKTLDFQIGPTESWLHVDCEHPKGVYFLPFHAQKGWETPFGALQQVKTNIQVVKKALMPAMDKILFDSGAQAIYVDEKTAKLVNEGMWKGAVSTKEEGTWKFKCSEIADHSMTFTFSVQGEAKPPTYTIHSQALFRPNKKNAEVCYSLVKSWPGKQWTFGQPFFRGRQLVFDYADGIGITQPDP